MKVVTLLENTTCRDDVSCAHGLSLYIETQRNKILFDMGPDESFLKNAEALGVDLSKVNIAFISHGHSDHAGGLEAFCRVNRSADVLVHPAAGGEFYALDGEDVKYIGVKEQLDKASGRTVPTAGALPMGQMLLFSGVPVDEKAMESSAMLHEKKDGEFVRDDFRHEQNLLVTENGRSVLFAGCAHHGIVSILETAEWITGKRPDVVFGGFHLFRLAEGDPAGDALIEETGRKLLEGDTVYYTGHCTGDYAYGKLKAILGDRLQPMTGGSVVEI